MVPRRWCPARCRASRRHWTNRKRRPYIPLCRRSARRILPGSTLLHTSRGACLRVARVRTESRRSPSSAFAASSRHIINVTANGHKVRRPACPLLHELFCTPLLSSLASLTRIMSITQVIACILLVVLLVVFFSIRVEIRTTRSMEDAERGCTATGESAWRRVGDSMSGYFQKTRSFFLEGSDNTEGFTMRALYDGEYA